MFSRTKPTHKDCEVRWNSAGQKRDKQSSGPVTREDAESIKKNLSKYPGFSNIQIWTLPGH